MLHTILLLKFLSILLYLSTVTEQCAPHKPKAWSRPSLTTNTNHNYYTNNHYDSRQYGAKLAKFEKRLETVENSRTTTTTPASLKNYGSCGTPPIPSPCQNCAQIVSDMYQLFGFYGMDAKCPLGSTNVKLSDDYIAPLTSDGKFRICCNGNDEKKSGEEKWFFQDANGGMHEISIIKCN